MLYQCLTACMPAAAKYKCNHGLIFTSYHSWNQFSTLGLFPTRYYCMSCVDNMFLTMTEILCWKQPGSKSICQDEAVQEV